MGLYAVEWDEMYKGVERHRREIKEGKNRQAVLLYMLDTVNRLRRRACVPQACNIKVTPASLAETVGYRLGVKA